MGARGAAADHLPRAARSCSTSAPAGAAAACARPRSSSSRSRAAESEELDRRALADGQRSPRPRAQPCSTKTEGNPLFVEETMRMLAERRRRAGVERIPDTLQALIAARIDRLRRREKALLQRAAVIGRIFWHGAIEHLSPELEALDVAARRPAAPRLRRSRSRARSISGETAFRFKHVLIREVAYAGLTKSARAEHHARFAEWLKERAGDELLEIRAYHLDHAASLLAELDGAAAGGARRARPPRRSRRPAGARSPARRTAPRAQLLAARGRARADARAAATWPPARRGGSATCRRSRVEMEEVLRRRDRRRRPLDEGKALTALAEVVAAARRRRRRPRGADRPGARRPGARRLDRPLRRAPRERHDRLDVRRPGRGASG